MLKTIRNSYACYAAYHIVVIQSMHPYWHTTQHACMIKKSNPARFAHVPGSLGPECVEAVRTPSPQTGKLEGQTIWKQTLYPTRSIKVINGNYRRYFALSILIFLKIYRRVAYHNTTLRRATTDPKFLWVLILMKLHMDLHVQASSLILSFWQTRCIFIRNNLILRFQTNANIYKVILGPVVLLHGVIWRDTLAKRTLVLKNQSFRCDVPTKICYLSI